LANRAAAGRLASTEYCFVPDAPLRVPTLLETLQSNILPLGNKYWTEVPEGFLESYQVD
jgi:hypothetical protein